ncbi:hypothetical protein DFJ77DRAFT_441959 [Powellomyces hirtus]|nr:hypothetical protein DFJ77DRAFT_441959 [Powellomyces hirtus]
MTNLQALPYAHLTAAVFGCLVLLIAVLLEICGAIGKLTLTWLIAYKEPGYLGGSSDWSDCDVGLGDPGICKPAPKIRLHSFFIHVCLSFNVFFGGCLLFKEFRVGMVRAGDLLRVGGIQFRRHDKKARERKEQREREESEEWEELLREKRQELKELKREARLSAESPRIKLHTMCSPCFAGFGWWLGERWGMARGKKPSVLIADIKM